MMKNMIKATIIAAKRSPAPAAHFNLVIHVVPSPESVSLRPAVVASGVRNVEVRTVVVDTAAATNENNIPVLLSV